MLPNTYIYIYIETIRTRSPSFFPLVFRDIRASLSNPRSRSIVREIMCICLRFIECQCFLPPPPPLGPSSLDFLPREGFHLHSFRPDLDEWNEIVIVIVQGSTRNTSIRLRKLIGVYRNKIYVRLCDVFETR